MNQLIEQPINCPYCGESICLLIDSTDMTQQYIEDCQVCCKPMNVLITQSIGGDMNVAVYSEDDTF